MLRWQQFIRPYRGEALVETGRRRELPITCGPLKGARRQDLDLPPSARERPIRKCANKSLHCPPVEGGKPSTYRACRRERPEGPCVELTTVFETQVSLADQPHGKEYEYCIIAANKAGDDEPSNTVMVVL